MTDPQRAEIIKSLKTPRSAAIAGIVFALLYGTALVLIRISIPADLKADNAWLETNADRVSLALNLVPFSGIAFLWFIGVIRDRLGDLEDRFFATVFLGSGLLFLAMTFAGAALAGGLLKTYTSQPSVADSSLYTYSRAVMYDVVNIYAIRMAGVFMISLATIWFRTGLMHRGWALAHLCAGADSAAERGLLPVGDFRVPGMGAGGQLVLPDHRTCAISPRRRRASI